MAAREFNLAEGSLKESFAVAGHELDSIGALVELYDAWHRFDPSAGHETSREHWRSRLVESE